MHHDLTAFRPMGGTGLTRGFALAIASVDLLAAWAVVVAIAVMVLLVAMQVLLRYAFNTSLAWTDETSRLAFVWSIFLGIPLGIRRGAHIGIAFVTARLATVPRDSLARAMALLGAALMALVSWQSVRIAWEQWDELMGTVALSSGWFMLAVAFGAGHSLLHLLWIVLNGPHEGHQITDEASLG
jgi:TRAP-type C4-dicarboxylate transport system permease small subunit